MNILYFLAISGFLNGVGALSIGLLAYFKRRKSNLHRIFAFLNVAIAIWALSYWRWLLADNYTSALFWARMLNFGATLIPIFLLHWILIFVGLAREKRLLLVLGYLMTVIFLSFSFSPYFVKSVESTFNFPYWPKPGILYHFYIIFSYITLLGYGIYHSLAAYRKVTGYKKAQLKYVFLGLAIAAPAGFTNFPLWYNINIPPYANFFVLAYVICFAYAMFRYRLMDIHVVVGRAVVYIISSLLIIGSSLLVIFINSQLPTPLSFPFLLPIIILLTFLFFQLNKVFERMGARYFYPGFSQRKIILSSLGEELTSLLELETFSRLITGSLKNAFTLEKIAVLTKVPRKEKFNLQVSHNFNGKEVIKLSEDKILNSLLKKMKKPFGSQEILELLQKEEKEEKIEDLKTLREKFDKLDIEISTPLLFEKEIIGIIFLGKKSLKDTFSKEDLNLLTTLSRQASVALKNTLLYSEVKKRKEELERFYRLTVGRELRMQELKKRINELEERTKELEEKLKEK